jgi:acetyl-CoA carboxylase biotin carboxyl carrier protein
MASPKIDKDLIRNLAELLEETGLSEIEWPCDGGHVRVARNLSAGGIAVAPAAAMHAAAQQPAGAPATPAEDEGPALESHPGAVLSPMVGTVYAAPEPSAPNFVKVGDTVDEGQTVIIVEAMKTMNHIPAPKAGKVTRILVTNEQPVEFGQVLMIIE